MQHSLVFKKKRKAMKSGMKFLLDIDPSNEIPILPYLVSAFVETIAQNHQHGWSRYINQGKDPLFCQRKVLPFHAGSSEFKLLTTYDWWAFVFFEFWSLKSNIFSGCGCGWNEKIQWRPSFQILLWSCFGDGGTNSGRNTGTWSSSASLWG